VLKYRGGLHRYIQEEMEFLDISSLGMPIDMSSKSRRSLNKRHTVWLWEPLTTEAGKGKPQPMQNKGKRKYG
jgi:hypothetical protein